MSPITRAADYAVRILVALLGAPHTRVRAADLADATALTEDHVLKVIVPLVRRGWVRSHRGMGGGFSLAVSGDQISLADVIELVEGPIRLQTCVGPGGCQFVARCPVHPVWLEAETELRKLLARYDLKDLAARAHRAGLFIPSPA